MTTSSEQSLDKVKVGEVFLHLYKDFSKKVELILNMNNKEYELKDTSNKTKKIQQKTFNENDRFVVVVPKVGQKSTGIYTLNTFDNTEDLSKRTSRYKTTPHMVVDCKEDRCVGFIQFLNRNKICSNSTSNEFQSEDSLEDLFKNLSILSARQNTVYSINLFPKESTDESCESIKLNKKIKTVKRKLFHEKDQSILSDLDDVLPKKKKKTTPKRPE